MTPALPHRLDRTLVVQAARDTAFSYFTDGARWASWWGTGSTVDARQGGSVLIRHPNGIEVSGEVLEVRAPERVVFTYGYASGAPIAPGGSRVTVRLDPHPRGTLLQLAHEFAEQGPRDEHVQGWRFQLSLLANLIANHANPGATALVDRWFDAWNEPNAGVRRERLSGVAAPAIQFRDRFSCIDGLDELTAHLDAVHRFMPGMAIARRGEVRHCQWTLLVDWAATGPDGQERGRGTNVFTLGADGRVTGVTGFWT